MKHIVTLILFIANVGFSQTAIITSIDAGGESKSISNLDVVYTIGETSVNEFVGTTSKISEGFIQVLDEDNTLSILNVETHSLSLYPNPSKNTLNVKYSGIIDYIEIYNIQGQLVLITSEHIIDVSQLLSSTYILKIKTNNSFITKRFIKD